MKVIEKGHIYQPRGRSHLDGKEPMQEEQRLTFINKQPGQEHEGTTTQEVIRILIDRTRHCNNCLPHPNNERVIYHLRMALVLHEARALERKTEKGDIWPEYISAGSDGHFALQTAEPGELDTTILKPHYQDWDRECDHAKNSKPEALRPAAHVNTMLSGDNRSEVFYTKSWHEKMAQDQNKTEKKQKEKKGSVSKLAKAAVLTFFGSIFLAACGTTQSISQAQINAPVPANHSRIVVQRNTSMLYFAAAATVKANGSEIASLGRGGGVTHDIRSGPLVLEISTPTAPGQFVVRLDAKPKQTYQFLVSPKSDALLLGSAFGIIGDAVNASISDTSGYFQLEMQ